MGEWSWKRGSVNFNRRRSSILHREHHQLLHVAVGLGGALWMNASSAVFGGKTSFDGNSATGDPCLRLALAALLWMLARAFLGIEI